MIDLPFVFCIGFNKCGTTSLFNFFRGNGFPCVHNAGGRLAVQMLANCMQQQPVFAGLDERYRCFSDMEFVNDRIAVEGNWYFRLMDRDYPNSFFIYNTRNMERWLSSRSRWIGPAGSYLERYKKMLNTTQHEVVVEHWRSSRLRFEAEMFDYFRGSKNLLVLDIEETRCPERIAEFLAMDLDAAHWGWKNRTPSRGQIQ